MPAFAKTSAADDPAGPEPTTATRMPKVLLLYIAYIYLMLNPSMAVWSVNETPLKL